MKIIKVQLPGWSDCAHLCFDKKFLCSHFTYWTGLCHLKRNGDGQHETNLDHAVCGFILGRSQQNYP